MKARDYREKAMSKIRGQWNSLALIALVEALILSFASSFVIGNFLIGGAITLGVAGISLAVVRGKEFEISNLFDGFKNFVPSLVLYLVNTILIALWSLLFIIPGIIKGYSYSMSFYILHDNPDMQADEARKKSIEMMNGHKWELFCLHFSFIGWFLLCGLTFGILSFWVLPYFRASEAEFYENLKANCEQNS